MSSRALQGCTHMPEQRHLVAHTPHRDLWVATREVIQDLGAAAEAPKVGQDPPTMPEITIGAKLGAAHSHSFLLNPF